MGWIKFISGDGVEHEVEETSAAAEVMRNAGFQRLDVEEVVYTDQDVLEQSDGEDATAKPVNLTKLNKAELVAKAEELGIDVVPDSMTKAQIIAAIEAAAIPSGEPEE